ncbi:MAG TPA: pantoate--beta-alanine ligase [Patescibacteria group bacterium]|nr:pantoate--beta-alanine ligase [Patescibacteria group bacterium]
MPSIVSDPRSWQKQRKELKGSLGFVPTMGNLHEGHIALAKRAKAENDYVLVSLFVNPTQFNQRADYEKYARTFDADVQLLAEAGVDFVLSPDEPSMYPDKYDVQVIEKTISKELEGEFRPGHFEGMLTVVLKLLNIAQADRAYFGEKDFQQLTLVRKMVEAFFIPTEIVPCPTIRQKDGLALSSRNGRLSPEQREQAGEISRLLKSALSDDEVMKKLAEAGFRPEYVATKWGRRLAAAWLGDVRLIDNVPLSEVKQERAA